MTTAPLLLDLRGLRCPLPVLRTRKALAELPAGARLRVESTDPLSAIDIPHMLNGTGDVLEAHERNGKVEIFVILRGS
jgi:tRNA 2-thiouridine synthesizing protein A